MKFHAKKDTFEGVMVKSTDYNPQAEEGQNPFDGFPFSEPAEWLIEQIKDRNCLPHNEGSTDYAQWHVKSFGSVKNATPGDWIMWNGKHMLVLTDSERKFLFEEVNDEQEA